MRARPQRNARGRAHRAGSPEISPRTCLLLRAISRLIRQDLEFSEYLPDRAWDGPWVGHLRDAINSPRGVASCSLVCIAAGSGLTSCRCTEHCRQRCSGNPPSCGYAVCPERDRGRISSAARVALQQRACTFVSEVARHHSSARKIALPGRSQSPGQDLGQPQRRPPATAGQWAAGTVPTAPASLRRRASSDGVFSAHQNVLTRARATRPLRAVPEMYFGRQPLGSALGKRAAHARAMRMAPLAAMPGSRRTL